MNDKIKLTKADGLTIDTDIICYIQNVKSGKKFLYYTLNEVTGAGPNSTVKIYVANIKQDNPALDIAITNEEWDALKGYMGDALKGTVNPDVKYLPIEELQNPVEVSERAIAMPTSYDYIAKQRGKYAEAIASAEPANITPAEPISAPVVEASPAPVMPTEPQVQPEATIEPALTLEPTPVAPVEPTPVPEPAPVASPEPVVEEPTEPLTTPTPEVSIVENTSSAANGEVGMGTELSPIDITAIEARYKDMFDTLNKLKEQELEAANRYNATLELSDMHKEQHASYVQNEQMKEAMNNPTFESATIEPTVNPAPVETPIANPTPAPATTIEPTPAPISEIQPAPAPQAVETNWFDMPANN